MGTEILCIPFIIVCSRLKVKLNNPLMGTEIFYSLAHRCILPESQVKLNNPLMGTEISHATMRTYVYNQTLG